MADSYFSLSAQTAERTTVTASEHTVGPWNPGLQHGGPPNALAVAVAERALADATGRHDLVALRLAADFIGAVPVGELDVRTRIVRTARSAALVEVTLAGEGRDCLAARVWFVRDSDTSAVAPPLGEATEPADVPAGIDLDFGYGASLEWRFVRSGLVQPGPGATWARPRVALIEGWELSGLARTVLVADSASGISAELDWARWSFTNVDLDVHLARPFDGDWVFVDAATQLGPNGSALARSTISDRRGVVGSGLQTLVLNRIPTA